MMNKKNTIINLSIVAYLAFFSLPMILVSGFPWWYKWYWMDGIHMLVGILGALIPTSPWAFLVMGAACYKKNRKLQAYVCVALFLWAAITELFIILYIQMLEHRIQPYFPPIRP